MRKLLYISDSGDGWRNLAIDEYFLNTLPPDCLLMYLYVNNRAIVVGKNQNAWRECDLRRMEEDGVQLVRRFTGGGTVYHDTGNLNFSFVSGGHYDVSMQTRLIADVVRSFGISCECTGRNDITADGRKFSGSAYAKRRCVYLHHGTILVSSRLDDMGKYLRPSRDKLRSKGVESVHARVCSLSEFVPGLTVEQVSGRLLDMYEEKLGTPEMLVPDADMVQRLYEHNASWEWYCGKSPAFDVMLENRFPWGEVQLAFQVSGGTVTACRMFTDALDTGLADRIGTLLTGVRFDRQTLSAAAGDKDIADWLACADL
jgi:lipoyltransferase and lipoate-protein ligase